MMRLTPRRERGPRALKIAFSRLTLLAACACGLSTHAVAAAAPKPAASGAHYFRMKQVQILDQTQGQGQSHPAYDLLIPTDWQFKGWVTVGQADGGCFADWFSAFGDAKSADGAIELQILPPRTWQYVTDPQAQQQITKENEDGAKYGLKPCPLRAPVHAADFLRNDLAAKYRQGKPIVSVEPFPDLDQLTRRRLGLPADGTGNPGGVHTEAARLRLAYDDDKGHPVEEWFTAAVVVHAYQAGRGVAYDWHVSGVMVLKTPKGQLDANDKLFKLIASTIHPDPAWASYSNGMIAKLYEKKQLEESKRSAAIAQFQQKVAETINGVVANREQGQAHSVHNESQIVRGVQTFRDPTTGATFELSNQYDHAWINGTNDYVMSDDPSFSPNAQLNGNWKELQLVPP